LVNQTLYSDFHNGGCPIHLLICTRVEKVGVETNLCRNDVSNG